MIWLCINCFVKTHVRPQGSGHYVNFALFDLDLGLVMYEVFRSRLSG